MGLAAMLDKWQIRREASTLALKRGKMLNQVKESGYMLYFVPKEMIDDEFVDAALDTCGQALEFVPRSMITPGRVERALANDALAFKHVPDEMKTLEMAIDSIQRMPLTIKSVPEHLQCEKVWLAYTNSSDCNFSDIPKQAQTREIAISYTKQANIVSLLNHVRPDLLTVEVLANLMARPYAMDRYMDMTMDKPSPTAFLISPRAAFVDAWPRKDHSPAPDGNALVSKDDLDDLGKLVTIARFAVAHSHMNEVDGVSVESLFEILIQPWETSVSLVQLEAMVRLENMSIESILPAVDTDFKSEICAAAFGPEAVIKHIKNPRLARRWLSVDMGI